MALGLIVKTGRILTAKLLLGQAVDGITHLSLIHICLSPFDRFRLRVEKEILLPEAVAQRGLAMGQRLAVEMALTQPEAAFQHIAFEIAAGIDGRAEGNPILAHAGVRQPPVVEAVSYTHLLYFRSSTSWMMS